MYRLWITICVLCGAVLLAAALLVPAHLRAVDAKAIDRAGAPTPSLIEEGLTFLSLEKVGPAQLLLESAQSENLRSIESLAVPVASFIREHPELVMWGGSDPMVENLGIPRMDAARPLPLVDVVMRRAVREKLLEFLKNSRRSGVQQIFHNRSITNTVHFPPATSSAGQAFDGAIVIAGLLFQGDHFTAPVRDTIEFLAMQSNKGGDFSQLELIYVDLLSLAKRLDWVSLTELVKKSQDINSLRQLADAARSHEDEFPTVFAAVQMSGQPNKVAKYLAEFPETGIRDLAFATRSGVGSVELLLKQQQRIYYASLRNRVAAYDPFGAWFYAMLPTAQNNPHSALLLKYFLLLLGSLCVARVVGVVGGSTQWLGMRLSADTILALGITFIIGVFSEPFLGIASQVHDFPIRFHIPTEGSVTIPQIQKLTRPNMNQMSLVPLLVFFVLQALIYVWCLAKLNEIRRQPLAARMKLRLLENEDHLFDAGLYIGFVGTIIALILFSLRISEFSVMSAYSSTSFGIIFVSVLKIFHIRPLRRKLIMESESEALETA